MAVAKLKAHLKLPAEAGPEDSLLLTYLTAAKEDADKFLNNPFTTYEVVNGDRVLVERDIPATIDLWVLNRAAYYYEFRTMGIQNESTDDLGEIVLSEHDPMFKPIKRWRLRPGIGGLRRRRM